MSKTLITTFYEGRKISITKKQLATAVSHGGTVIRTDMDYDSRCSRWVDNNKMIRPEWKLPFPILVVVKKNMIIVFLHLDDVLDEKSIIIFDRDLNLLGESGLVNGKPPLLKMINIEDFEFTNKRALNSIDPFVA